MEYSPDNPDNSFIFFTLDVIFWHASAHFSTVLKAI